MKQGGASWTLRPGPVLSLERLRAAAEWAAVLSAVAASLFFAGAPVYATEAQAIASSGAGARTTGWATLAAVNGAVAYVWLLLPVAVGALPLLFRRSRHAFAAAVTSAVVLFAFVVLGSATIGGAFLPAAAFALLAAALARAARPAT
jgi:hypothetical protein